jgi:hypothetical protein
MSTHLKKYLDSLKIAGPEGVSPRSFRVASKWVSHLVDSGVLPINDANTTLFTAAQLDQVEAAFIAHKRLSVEAPALIPLVQTDSGAESYSWQVYDAANEAAQAADGAVITPSDLSGAASNTAIIQYRDSFTLSDQEMRQAAMSGRPIETFGAQSVSANLQDRQDQCAMIGDGTRLGLLNATGTTTYTVPADGTGTSALWSTKTGDLILRDMLGCVDRLPTVSSGKYVASHLVMGADRLRLISGMKRTAAGGTDQTVLQAFQQARPNCQVVGTYFMNDTPVAVTTVAGKLSQRLVAFESQPYNLGRVVAMGPSILSIDVLNLVSQFQAKCRNAGTIVRRVQSVCVGLPASGGI